MYYSFNLDNLRNSSECSYFIILKYLNAVNAIDEKILQPKIVCVYIVKEFMGVEPSLSMWHQNIKSLVLVAWHTETPT